jgi:NADPH-dependent F420 reductase
MNITIIGPGKMGHAIGTRAVAGGHSVTFVGHTPGSAEKAAEELKPSAKKGAQTSAAPLADAAQNDVIILAVPYGTNIELVKQLGSKLAGKVVVDIANPLNSTYNGLVTSPDSSSAEEVAKAAAPGTKVVKAFNTDYASTLLARQVAGQPLDVFIAGDDADAKAKIVQLVTDAGLRPIDAGPLARARQIEAMQLLHITLQSVLGTNFGSAIKILS